MRIRLDTSEKGLEAVVGSLEARVLKALWEAQRPLTNRQIRREVERAGHTVKLTTITTVTKRMSVRRLLLETAPHDIYEYLPALSEVEFIECVIQRVLGTLILSWPEVLETYIEGITSGKELYYGAQSSH